LGEGIGICDVESLGRRPFADFGHLAAAKLQQIQLEVGSFSFSKSEKEIFCLLENT
jgi:hypothetical protein